MNLSKVYILLRKGEIEKTLNALEKVVSGIKKKEIQEVKTEWKQNKAEIQSDPLKKAAFITHLLSLIKTLEEENPEIPTIDTPFLPVSIEKLLEGLNPDLFEGLNLNGLNLKNLDLSLNERGLNQNIEKVVSGGKNNLTWMDTYDILKNRVKFPLEEMPTSGAEPPEEETNQTGMLLHCIPRKMQVGTAHRCIIRIAQDEKTVLKGLPDYAENQELKEIEISEEMEVTFIPTHHFEITPINSAKQKIRKKFSTEWNFDVTPKSLGTFPLNFVVSIIYYDDDGEQKREVTLTERIMVSTESVASTLEFTPSSLKTYQPDATSFPILMLTANPAGTTKLSLDKEHSRIAEKLQNHPLYFPLIVKRAVDKVVFREEIIAEKPGFLHFSGHGTIPDVGTPYAEASKGGLVVQNEDHNGFEQINTAALSVLFEYFKEEAIPIKAVILNACFSEEQAKAIAGFVPYVIGTTQNIKDSHAIAFSTGFYFRLMERYPETDIEMAFKSGRTSAVLEGAEKQSFVIFKDGVKIAG